MTFDKGATFWNNKKKDWFSHETRLAFVYGKVFKERSRNSAIFKMELFATTDNGRAYNQRTVVFACCCGNSTIFTSKNKIRWKWACLKGGIRHNFLFCRHDFTFFLKIPITFITIITFSLTFHFISKMNYKNENWYHCWFYPPVFY